MALVLQKSVPIGIAETERDEVATNGELAAQSRRLNGPYKRTDWIVDNCEIDMNMILVDIPV